MIKGFKIKFVNFILIISIFCTIISTFSLLWFSHYPIKMFDYCIYYKTTLYNFIYITEWKHNGDIVRCLNRAQSVVKINKEPNNYFSKYIEIFSSFFVQKTKRNNILMLGNAAGSLLSGLLYYIDQNKIKNVNFDIVEINMEFTKIGEDYFNLPKNDKRVKYYYEDARTFLNKKQIKKYDLIFYDIFDDTIPLNDTISPCWPYYLLTNETFEELFNKLDEDGILLLNAVGSLKTNIEYLRQVYTQLTKTFPFVTIYKVYDSGNFIFAVTKKFEIEDTKKIKEHLKELEIIKLEKTKELFTDNYSPVEKFIY